MSSSLRVFRSYVTAAVISLCLIATLHAQNYRAKISGTVTDATGAVVPSATATLQNVNTGIKIVRNTSETGLFLFDLVDPGTYSVTIEATGFSTFIQENVQVQSRDDVTVNAALRTGGVQETVTVVDSPVAVQFTPPAEI